MEAAVFICCAVVLGLTAFFAHLPLSVVGAGLPALFAIYLSLALRRHRLAIRPLLADFSRCRQHYEHTFGHTRSGAKFLEFISKPLLAKNGLDEALNNIGEVGQFGYGVVTDPASALPGLALAPVFAGLGKLIGGIFSEKKPPEQTQAEAVLLRARYALDRRSDSCYHGITAAGAAVVGVFLFCAFVPPPKPARPPAANRTAADNSDVAPFHSPTAPAPVTEAGPYPGSLTPPPVPSTVGIEAEPPPANTPPGEVFGTVAQAQRVAMERHPALGVAGSRFNAAFIARYKLYQQTRPDYFQDNAWPVRLAEEISRGAP